MAAGDSLNRRAIMVRGSLPPVLMHIRIDDGSNIVLEPEDDQPPCDVLMDMIAAQGGLHRPGGLFRFDPELAVSGIKSCPNCGRFWISRSDDPDFLPKKCAACQRPLRPPASKPR